MSDPSSPQPKDLANLKEEEILAHLRGLDRDRFEQLRKNPHFHSRHIVTVMRDMSLSSEIIEAVYEDDEMISDYRVKASMAQHPHTPKIVAMELLRHLFWRDLLLVIGSLKVHPQVRRNAEHILSEQIEDLTLGERLTIARMATRSVIRMLRTTQDVRVLKPLLLNSRLTEEDVLFMASRSETRPDVLRLIGRAPRWASRYPVRLALVRNPKTPPAVSLGIVSGLKEPDLQGLVHTPSVPYVVRRTAERVLSEGRHRR